MFVTYPIEATTHNWIHECICAVLETICNSINDGNTIPNWPDILPSEHRAALSSRKKLPKLLRLFADEANKLTIAERADFISLMAQQNQITGLLDGSAPIPMTKPVLKPLVQAAKEVYDEGFSLLTKKGIRDHHYSIIWDSLKSKTCPFCGIEPFDSPKLPREDEDHYLARSIYPLAAANFFNLIPMGSKCNKLFKGQVDILHLNDNRRKAYNPYGSDWADIMLENSVLFGSPDGIPEWQIDLIPDIEEARTWENVFSIRSRLTESVLNPYYFDWLGEIPDWFKVSQIDEQIDNEDLLTQLEKFAAYKRDHKEVGPGFLKVKVIEMLIHHFKQENVHLIAMIRSCLPKQATAA